MRKPIIRTCLVCKKEFSSIKKIQECCSNRCSQKKKIERYGHFMTGKEHTQETKDKMRKAHLGKPMNIGKENPNWQEGVSRKWARHQLKGIPNCELCGKNKGLIVHHKDKNPENNERSNLIKVCKRCHLIKCHIQHYDKLKEIIRETKRDTNGRFKPTEEK